MKNIIIKKSAAQEVPAMTLYARSVKIGFGGEK